MLPSNFQAMAALDASVDETSAAFPTDHVFGMSAIVTTTGTSTGTLKIQVSNDIGLPGPSGTFVPANWVDSTQTVTVSAAGTALIPYFNYSYEYCRFVWTHNNGAAGTITVNVKTIGD